jgi:hypothetical protein
MNGRSMFFPYSCRMFGSKCPQQSSNLTNTLVMEKLNTIQVRVSTTGRVELARIQTRPSVSCSRYSSFLLS